MQNNDFTSLTDEELDEARIGLTNECERRQRLATAVETVRAVATRYVEDGGDSADLVASIPS